jgi:S-adenosylmethionine decarboxylase proenzyme
MTKHRGFGPHLIIEASGCSKRILDTEIIRKFLEKAVKRLKLTKISEPFVEYYDLGKWNRGVSGIILISESHITIHTFIKEGWIFVDVFSCKEINQDGFEKMIRKEFKPKRMESTYLRRGKGFKR